MFHVFEISRTLEILFNLGPLLSRRFQGSLFLLCVPFALRVLTSIFCGIFAALCHYLWFIFMVWPLLRCVLFSMRVNFLTTPVK